MTRTEPFRTRRCRPAGADFGLCLIGACLAFAGQAADVPVAVTSPKPVVIQPSAATPPPIPEAVAAQPTAKGAGSAKSGKQSKPVKAAARQKTVKPASKPKAQARKR